MGIGIFKYKIKQCVYQPIVYVKTMAIYDVAQITKKMTPK